MRFATLLASAALSAAATTTTLAQDLLFNGGLQSGGFLVSGWGNFGNVSVDAEIEVSPREGAESVKMFGGFAGQPGDGAQSDTGLFQNGIVVTPNTTYALSGFTYTPGTDPIQEFVPESQSGVPNFGHLPLIIIDFFDGSGAPAGSAQANAYDFAADSTDTWIRRELVVTSPANAATANVVLLLIQFDHPTGSLFWDDFSLVEGGSPPTSGGLIADGSFEGLDPFASDWGGFGNTSLDAGGVEVAAQDGSNSIKMFGGFGGVGVQTEAGAFQNDISVDPGAEYALSAFTQIPSSDPIRPVNPDSDGMGNPEGQTALLIIDFFDASGNPAGSAEVDAADAANDAQDVWIERSLTVTAPSNAASANVTLLFLQFGDPNGSLFWDNVTLVESADPVCDEADFNGDGNIDSFDISEYIDLVATCAGTAP